MCTRSDKCDAFMDETSRAFPYGNHKFYRREVYRREFFMREETSATPTVAADTNREIYIPLLY